MLSQGARNSLERYAGKRGAAIETLMVLAFVFSCLISAFRLFMAIRLGSLGGFDVPALLRGWLAGIQVDQHYSGIHVKALAELDVTFLYLACALGAAGGVVAMRGRRRRDQEIIAVLKEHGGW